MANTIQVLDPRLEAYLTIEQKKPQELKYFSLKDGKIHDSRAQRLVDFLFRTDKRNRWLGTFEQSVIIYSRAQDKEKREHIYHNIKNLMSQIEKQKPSYNHGQIGRIEQLVKQVGWIKEEFSKDQILTEIESIADAISSISTPTATPEEITQIWDEINAHFPEAPRNTRRNDLLVELSADPFNLKKDAISFFSAIKQNKFRFKEGALEMLKEKIAEYYAKQIGSLIEEKEPRALDQLKDELKQLPDRGKGRLANVQANADFLRKNGIVNREAIGLFLGRNNWTDKVDDVLFGRIRLDQLSKQN